MRISDWVSDVCSSDLGFARVGLTVGQWKLLARVGTRTIGGVTVAVFSRHGKEAAIAEIESSVAAGIVEFAITLVELAIAIVGASAAVGALEHDVDHTGNGVGTILRRRTVTQYLYAGDGAAARKSVV